MMETTTQAFVKSEDLEPWLQDLGFEMKQVLHAVINMGAHMHGSKVWIEIEFFKLDENGKHFIEKQGDDWVAATGIATIPVTSWPKLTVMKADTADSDA